MILVVILVTFVLGVAVGYGLARYVSYPVAPALPAPIAPSTQVSTSSAVTFPEWAPASVIPAPVPLAPVVEAPPPVATSVTVRPIDGQFHIQLRNPDGSVVLLAASDDAMDAKRQFETHPAHGANPGSEIHLFDRALGLSRTHRVVP